ncbi:MAG: hypothetical protein V4703_06175, partial [Actinomycetota bacterium]
MQQGGVRRALIEGQEGDVGDAGEPFQRASDLTTGVDPQRTGAHLIRDDGDVSGRADESAQLGMIAKEPRHRKRVGRSDGHHDVRFAQHGRGGGIAPRAGEIVGDLLVGVEGSR